MKERDALLKAVCDNPDDDTPRLVFADWLDEHGEPARAEFIRVQVALAKSPDATLLEREAQLLEAHKQEWAAPFKEFGCYRTDDPCVFRRGFVDEVYADPEAMADDGNRLFKLAPVRALAFSDAEEDEDFAKRKWLLKLHTLDLTGSGLSHHFGLVGPLMKSKYLANLTTLRLCGEDDNGHLDAAGVRALVASKHLGGLRELDLSGNWLNQSDPGTLSAFLAATNLPGLRVLRMTKIGFGWIDVSAIADAPWLGQLDELDLRRNGLTDEDIARLAARFGDKVKV